MFGPLISVALGGALGASLRYLFGVGVFRLLGPTSFPVAIIGVNVIGSFLMGAFVVIAAQRGLTHLSPLVMTGFLGGFTTFSAFSLEALMLAQRGAVPAAMAYVGASLVGCLFAAWLGFLLTSAALR
jgi:CrcB protein